MNSNTTRNKVCGRWVATQQPNEMMNFKLNMTTQLFQQRKKYNSHMFCELKIDIYMHINTILTLFP